MSLTRPLFAMFVSVMLVPFVSASAFADTGAPTVVTGSNPVATGGMSGTLTGSVNPNGGDTSAHVLVDNGSRGFRYSSPVQDVGAGTVPVSLSFNVDLVCPYRSPTFHPGSGGGLTGAFMLIPQCPEKFFYQVIAKNANGTSTGGRMVFNPGALGFVAVYTDIRSDSTVAATVEGRGGPYTLSISTQSFAGGGTYTIPAGCAMGSVVSAQVDIANFGPVCAGPLPKLGTPRLEGKTRHSLTIAVSLDPGWGLQPDCGGTISFEATDPAGNESFSPTVGTCTGQSTIAKLADHTQYTVNALVTYSTGQQIDSASRTFETKPFTCGRNGCSP